MSTLLNENALREAEESHSSREDGARVDVGSVAARSEHDPNTRNEPNRRTFVCHCCFYCTVSGAGWLHGGDGTCRPIRTRRTRAPDAVPDAACYGRGWKSVEESASERSGHRA